MKIIETYKKYHRIVNYISAAQLYLKDNFDLRKELAQEHLKTRILGHWGTVPGINFVYGGLSHIIKKTDKDVMLIVGPGHGAPAILANIYLEGTLADINPKYKVGVDGMGKLIHDFSWPNGFDSHTSPKLPGSIYEGGELGYSLATAFGTVLDNPDLITACLIGDGEAETATLSASWHLNKFLNPAKDGVVLPILHLNGYKISAPTVFSTMNDAEISNYFLGLGYNPIFVNQYQSIDIYIDMLQGLINAFEQLENRKRHWSTYATANPLIPVIILKTKKGWGGPVEFLGQKIEDNNLSHGIPLKRPSKDVEEFNVLKSWLESYRIHELIDSDGVPLREILDFFPNPNKRLSASKYAYQKASTLKLPSVFDHELKFKKAGSRPESRMAELSQYIRDIFELNTDAKNFQMFSPDESESNMLESVFQQTGRKYLWPIRAHDDDFSTDGRIIELLSENVLFAMMVGYVVTGRHGVLISYEAFLNVISSQIDQFIKFTKQRKKERFLNSIPSINLVATSTLWRQEHNGFTHQNPTLINSLITKYADFVHLFFPPDANSLIVASARCFESVDRLNYITACKKDLPQWVTMSQAIKEFKHGYGHWRNLENDLGGSYDVVLVSIGDYQTNENFQAAALLQKLLPELHFKFININQLSQAGLGNPTSPIDKPKEIHNVFEKDIDVIFNFHGYPTAIQQLIFKSELAIRSKILGYIEQGTTTTPLNMQMLNNTSRYHIAIEAIESASKVNKSVAEKKHMVIDYINSLINRQLMSILQVGEDIPDDF